MKLKFRSKRPPTEFKFLFARRPIEKIISCRRGVGGILFSGTALTSLFLFGHFAFVIVEYMFVYNLL
jgi:hypothetical protein